MGSKKDKKKESSSEGSSESSDDSISSSSDSEKKSSKSKRSVIEPKHIKASVDSRNKRKASSSEEMYEGKRRSDERKSHKDLPPNVEHISEKYDKKSKHGERRYEPKEHHERSKDRREEYYERSKDRREEYYERSRERRDDRRKDDYDKHERDRYGDRDRNNRENYPRDRNRPYRDDRGRRDRRNESRRSSSFDHTNAKWGKSDDKHIKTEKESQQKDKPNFGLSGKLTEDTNTFKGVVIKYSEPPEARKPRRRWRLYPFKGEKALQTLYIHRQSGYLIGRDRKVVDLPVDHPSCSKQHAALQYRLVPFTREDGSAGKRVRPYLIDLESANGTFINNKKIESRKYVELLEKDVIKFGFSSREYVLLHENSKDEAMDDDVKQEENEAVVKDEPV